ncbi:MAG: hypothetical protein ACPGSD_02785 [Flavobacteriales bacterium]
MLRLLMLTLTLLLLSCNNISEDQNILEEYSGTWKFKHIKRLGPSLDPITGEWDVEYYPGTEKILFIYSNSTFSLNFPQENIAIEGDVIVNTNGLIFETDTGSLLNYYYNPDNLPNTTDSLDVNFVLICEEASDPPCYFYCETYERIYD